MKITKKQLEQLIESTVKQKLLNEDISDSFEMDELLNNILQNYLSGGISATESLIELKQELSFNKGIMKKLNPNTKESFRLIVDSLKKVANEEKMIFAGLKKELKKIDSRLNDPHKGSVELDSYIASQKNRRR